MDKTKKADGRKRDQTRRKRSADLTAKLFTRVLAQSFFIGQSEN
jgi:hypothetical protein